MTLGAGSLTAHAAARPGRPTPAAARITAPSTVVLRRHLAANGIYEVRVGVADPPNGRTGAFTLRIGRKHRAGTLSGTGRRVWVSAVVTIRHGHLAILATEAGGRPALAVKIVRMHGLPSGLPAAPKPRTLASSGASGATGLTGPTGPVAPVATRASTPVGAPPTPPPPPVPAGATGPPGNPLTWHQIFADDFNGPALDATKWSTGWFGSGITAPVSSGELECYDPSQVALGGGELDLNLIAKAESCGGQNRSYASGIITTNGKFSFTYGYFEARAWVPGNGSISDWPAIWTDGQSWPVDGEMDVLEGLGGLACWHFHDPLGGPGDCASPTVTGGWHTFGADWEPSSVTYYYDGAPVGTINAGVTNAPMYVIVNLAADGVYGGAVQAPATLRVDYVRVWQH